MLCTSASGHHSWGFFLLRPWRIRPPKKIPGESSFSRNYFIFQREEVWDLHVLVDSNQLQNSSCLWHFFLFPLLFLIPHICSSFSYEVVSLAVTFGSHLAFSCNIPHTTVLLFIIALLVLCHTLDWFFPTSFTCTVSKQIIKWTNASHFLCSQCREVVIAACLISPILNFYAEGVVL